jgi:hypothetical protein
MQTLTRAIGPTLVKPVPNRPAISNVLLKASANVAFRTKLLTDPQDALTEMNLPPEDAEVLADVQAPTLKEYARQVKMRLMVSRLGAARPIS